MIKSGINTIKTLTEKANYSSPKKPGNIARYFSVSKYVENDPISETRICTICKKRLKYENFSSKGERRIRSACKSCRNIKDSIRALKKKLAGAIFVLLKERGENSQRG